MKKIISITTVSLLLATTLATTSPSDTMNLKMLNKNDSHMLFGDNNQNIITLGKNEMQKTEGEFWHIVAYIAILGLSYANTPTSQNDIYTGRPIGEELLFGNRYLIKCIFY